jgi:hypothetical protein
VCEEDQRHWKEVQDILKTQAGELDDWKVDFLHSIKWAPTLTKAQVEKLEAIKQAYDEQSREFIRQQRVMARAAYQYAQEQIQIERQKIQAQAEVATNRITVEQQLAQDLLQIDAIRNSTQLQQGLILDGTMAARQAAANAVAYAQEAAFEARSFAIKRDAINKQLGLNDLTLDARASLLNELLKLEEDYNNRVTTMNSRYAVQRAQDQATAAQAVQSRWERIVNPVGNALNSAFTSVYTYTSNMKDALLQAADQAIMSFVQMGIQALTKAAATQLGLTQIAMGGAAARTGVKTAEVATETALQTAQLPIAAGLEGAKTGVAATGAATRVAVTAGAAAAQTGIEASAAATSMAITASTGSANIAVKAVEAAAGAYAAISAIPVVGPFLAPAVAAGALVAVLALGKKIFSAKGGEERVPYDGAMYELHKDEMVLPANFANKLRASLSNVGPRTNAGMYSSAMMAGGNARSEVSNSNSASFNYSPTHNYQDANLQKMLQKDGDTFRRWFSNELRNGRIKVS